jgi:GT2 family glycosyltransferase
MDIVVADNDSSESAAIQLLREVSFDPRVNIIHIPGLFNFSYIVNVARRAAKGKVLLLLNNDTEVIEKNWLREMVSHAIRPDVGAVGAKLIYENGKIQHAGTVIGVGGVGAHLLTGLDRSDPGPAGILGLLRSVSAVTGACLAIRTEVWDAVGGMDEQHLIGAFNDVDLCLRIRDLGLRIVWTPFAELKHHESASRGLDIDGEQAIRFKVEVDWMKLRWGNKLERDPYYSINYKKDDAHCQLEMGPPIDNKRYEYY